MPDDLSIWIERYAEQLGCDCSPAAVAVAVEDLLAERDRQRKTIGRLRGRNAELMQAEVAKASAR